MEIISVIIADDHIIFRKGLRTILNEIPEIKVVAEASNGQELLQILKTQQVDIILMDIKMPLMDGLEATEKISKKYPDIKVIALTMHEEIGYFNQMIDAGAVGFLLKKTNKDELETAIKSVIEGDNYFSQEFITSINKHTMPKRVSNINLSDREMEVLELICKGFSNVEISKQLGISQRTIDSHRSRLFEKTGAKNAPNLVLFAIKNGLIDA
ncbi:MAG: response regulator transcription factor [Bacteroidales bacterium]|nr:response regulator transcription factor [Bacteroidales bacterium]